jgi:hypothetical protein
MDHNMVFTLDVDNNKIDNAKKYTYFAGNFDHHVGMAVTTGGTLPDEAHLGLH